MCKISRIWFANGDRQLVRSEAIGALGYMAFLVLIGALQLVLIQQPIMAHVIARTWVVNADALALVRQRVGEAGADADGFAEALDVGGAF